MRLKEFDYNLPKELIAQKPIRPRDHSRMMVLDKNKKIIKHCRFFDIEKFFKKGDVLVLNNTKVFKARLIGKVGESKVEIFLLRQNKEEFWQVLAKPGKKLKQDKEIVFSEKLKAKLVEKLDGGIYLIDFNLSNSELFKIIDKIGHVPVPPYIKKEPEKEEDYQTVYAQNIGSVAAPTAGFHFTKELIEKLKYKGVIFKYVTLHVGLGTFQPVKIDNIKDHKMHSEFVSISKDTADYINKAKKDEQSIISVGTTACRVLEGVASLNNGLLVEYNGDVDIFMYPGYDFKIIDGLITNFHLPKSTLLMLVSALAGNRLIKKAYKEAIDNRYRFFSFGDAMFIS